MLTFLRKAFEFVARPSHSRTLGLVLMLVLVAAVSLTVYVAQQQQETRQRASGLDDFNLCLKESTDEFETCKTGECGTQPTNEALRICTERYCLPDYQTRNLDCANQFLTPTPAQIAIAPTDTPIPTPTPTKLTTSIPCGGVICDPGQYCKSSGSDEFCADLPATPTLTPTPTPVKLTNCEDLLCTGNQKCLIEQAGEGEGVKIFSCITPTPTPTKTLPPTPTPKIVAPIPTGPIKCTVGSEIYYCDQGFSCGGETDKACIENTPTPPTLTRCTEFKHINTRVRKFKSNEVAFESINTCIRQFKGL